MWTVKDFINITGCWIVTTDGASSCTCGCFNLNYNFDDLDPETQEKILEMKKNLTVSTKDTSSYKRSLVSSSDSRSSAKAVGSVGLVILIVIGVFMLLADFTRLFIKPNDYQNMD